jgi:hypothetical protein
VKKNSKFSSFLASGIKKHSTLVNVANQVTRHINDNRVVFLDYPVYPKQRWNTSNPHSELWEIINANRSDYVDLLKSFVSFTKDFSRIPKRHSNDSSTSEPRWINGWMPAMDGIALYSLIALRRPKCFVEVGSGISTKFAKRAITDHQLDTQIISIDPHPRVEIDLICDRVIREPVEAVGLDIFDKLDRNDILYIDNSHRVFMNSDATVIFLDVIPRLKSGVLVQIHDVMLPYDYPVEWVDRYYSEQYLLAAYLLARGQRLRIVLPNAFISGDPELRNILSPLWLAANLNNVETHGVSFWFQTT